MNATRAEFDRLAAYDQHRRIVQIMPATGFLAVYAVRNGDEVSVEADPVACFALIEENDPHIDGHDRIFSEVHAMVRAEYGRLVLSQDVDNIIGMATFGEDINDWLADARDYFASKDRMQQRAATNGTS